MPSRLLYSRKKLQKRLQALVDARCHHGENKHYDQNASGCLYNLGEGRPGYPFQLGKGFFEFSAHSYENVGLFYFVFICHNTHRTPRPFAPRKSYRRVRLLLGFFMLGMLFAERAVLGNNEPVRVVTLILVAVVISVLAFGAFKSYLSSR